MKIKELLTIAMIPSGTEEIVHTKSIHRGISQ